MVQFLKLILFPAMQHHEPFQDQEFALATLAACSAATHVRKRQIRRLLDIASGEVSNVGKYKIICIITARILSKLF